MTGAQATGAQRGSPRSESLLPPTLIFAVVHLLLVIAVFLSFGLGLEGPTIGGKILFVLEQPLLSIPGLGALPAKLQNALIPVNSAIWGFAVAWGLRALRRRRSFGAGS